RSPFPPGPTTAGSCACAPWATPAPAVVPPATSTSTSLRPCPPPSPPSPPTTSSRPPCAASTNGSIASPPTPHPEPVCTTLARQNRSFQPGGSPARLPGTCLAAPALPPVAPLVLLAAAAPAGVVASDLR